MNQEGHSRPSIAIVAAVARNGVIGRNGRLPWTLPGDLAHFRATTLGHPVIMGRRTFDSIGAPLPGRTSIVLTRAAAALPPEVLRASDLDVALGLAHADASRRGTDTIIVAGGGAVYAMAIARADQLLVTLVAAAPDGDVMFPPIDPAIWTKIDDRPGVHAAGDSADYRFTRWIRHPAHEGAVEVDGS